MSYISLITRKHSISKNIDVNNTDRDHLPSISRINDYYIYSLQCTGNSLPPYTIELKEETNTNIKY